MAARDPVEWAGCTCSQAGDFAPPQHRQRSTGTPVGAEGSTIHRLHHAGSWQHRQTAGWSAQEVPDDRASTLARRSRPMRSLCRRSPACAHAQQGSGSPHQQPRLGWVRTAQQVAISGGSQTCSRQGRSGDRAKLEDATGGVVLGCQSLAFPEWEWRRPPMATSPCPRRDLAGLDRLQPLEPGVHPARSLQEDQPQHQTAWQPGGAAWCRFRPTGDRPVAYLGDTGWRQRGTHLPQHFAPGHKPRHALHSSLIY